MSTPGISGKKRLFILLAFIGVLYIALCGRLFYIQVIQGPELQEKALSQWTRDTELTAARGRILDREGIVLAQSSTAYKILLWPQQMAKYVPTERERIASELARMLNMDKDYVLSKVSDVTKQEIVLKRQVERSVVDEISSLKLGNGVVTAIDTKRYYPSGSLFSQVLGFTTVDSVGQEGIESAYNKYLAGEEGRLITETDRKGNPLAYGAEEYVPPTDGYDMVLTTDSVIQSFLTKALEEALTVNKAKTAQGVIMDCTTGEILAISTKPDYDPNDPPRNDMQTLRELVKNRVVCDAYEPGSTFKIITLSAALDSGAVDDSMTVDCPGFKIVNGERIKCWKSGGHGHQTLIEAVENSCNPAFMEMALRMDTETFYNYIYAFGFGASTKSGLNGESGGIVTHEKYIRQNTLARIGFGQSIAVTPIQLVSAVSAAVNGGNLMQPYIVDRMISQAGDIITDNEPVVLRRVVSEKTSQRVREILESVVQNGSGRNAQIAGYRVGGKTGTAQKYDESGASSSKLIASFIGFAPANDPKYVCLILVDEPQVGTIFGSTVAAPFVRQVMEETLRHYGYLPEQSAAQVQVPDLTGKLTADAAAELKQIKLGAVYQDEDEVVAQVPAAGEWAIEGTEVLLYTATTSAPQPELEPEKDEMIVVPDVLNMTRLEAHDALKEAGLNLVIDPPDQTGKAIRQKPAAQESVLPGSDVIVEFSDLDF